MKTSDFEYELPDELIAQQPWPDRDGCRMLVMDRKTGHLEDRIFRDIVDYVKPGDLFVVNETRVIPARLAGKKRGSGGVSEILLLREVTDPQVCAAHALPGKSANQQALWEALVKPGKRLKPGSGAVVDIPDADGGIALSGEIVDWAEGNTRGGRVVRLSTDRPSLDEALHEAGRTPLPPYIRNYAGDDEMYQTVYSRRESSAAAPTAGLHFTPELIERVRSLGAGWETVELEVGIDTFRIVDEDDPTQHAMHTEYYTVPESTVETVKRTKANGGRVIAVGTTSVRSLESAWSAETGCIEAKDRATTSLFLLPGSEFHVVDALITNFHVPRSTLMMLVSAFSTRDNIMAAYRHAVEERYRFFSFGDAMFIC